MLADDVFIGLAAIIAALGPSLAAVIVAVRQNRATRAEVSRSHEETRRKVDEKAAEAAVRSDALHDTFTGYMAGVNELLQLSRPFMEDYRRRNP